MYFQRLILFLSHKSQSAGRRTKRKAVHTCVRTRGVRLCAHHTPRYLSHADSSLLTPDNFGQFRSITFLAHAFHAHETTVGHGFIYTTSDSGVSESRARGALRDSRTLASHTLSLRSTVSTRVSQPRTHAHTSARLSHALLYGSCCVASCARVTLCPVSHLRPAHVSRFDPKVPLTFHFSRSTCIKYFVIRKGVLPPREPSTQSALLSRHAFRFTFTAATLRTLLYIEERRYLFLP